LNILLTNYNFIVESKKKNTALKMKKKCEKLITNDIFEAAYFWKVRQYLVQFETTGHGGQVLH